MGGLCSLISGMMFFLYFLLRTGDFILKVDPLVTMSNMIQKGDESINLFEHGYRFAIQKIDPRYGRIIVTQGFKDENGKR